jgi:hypothetical protein
MMPAGRYARRVVTCRVASLAWTAFRGCRYVVFA